MCRCCWWSEEDKWYTWDHWGGIRRHWSSISMLVSQFWYFVAHAETTDVDIYPLLWLGPSIANVDRKYIEKFFHLKSLLPAVLQEISGVPKIKEGFNPATWMLDATNAAVESHLKVDFAEIYQQSTLFGFVISLFHESNKLFNLIGLKLDLHFCCLSTETVNLYRMAGITRS